MNGDEIDYSASGVVLLGTLAKASYKEREGQATTYPFGHWNNVSNVIVMVIQFWGLHHCYDRQSLVMEDLSRKRMDGA